LADPWPRLLVESNVSLLAHVVSSHAAGGRLQPLAFGRSMKSAAPPLLHSRCRSARARSVTSPQGRTVRPITPPRSLGPSH